MYCVNKAHHDESIAHMVWALEELRRRVPLRNDYDAYLHEIIGYGLDEVELKPTVTDWVEDSW